MLSGVLDCSDGELARLRFAETRLGHWLDIIGDTLVHLAVLGGVAARLARVGTLPGWGLLVVLALGVLGVFAVITWSERTEHRRRRIDAWENRVLDRVLTPLTTRDWYVFVVAFAVAGSLELLVPAAAVGAHVFWLVALVLLVRVLGRT
jgi:phosphatidylglycerophosphate synthase